MTDFEDRLTVALRSAGDDAPDAAGLAPAARRRAGARRRRTALASAAAVVAVAGVVGGVALLGNGTTAPAGRHRRRRRRPRPLPTDVGLASSPGATSASRCPPTGATARCRPGAPAAASPATPVVERPGGAVEDILCDPGERLRRAVLRRRAADAVERVSSGSEQGDVGAPFPDGSGSGWDQAAATALLVVAPTQRPGGAGARRPSSASRASTPTAARRTPLGPDAAVSRATVRLCRYGIDDWLEQSELLDRPRTRPTPSRRSKRHPAKGDRMCTMALTGPRIRVTDGGRQGWVTLDACHGFAGTAASTT